MISNVDEKNEPNEKEVNLTETTVNLCYGCGRKVVDAMKCVKCQEIFHPSCWNTSKLKKSATCEHVEVLSPEEKSISTVPETIDHEKEYLKMQVKLLNQLLDEVRSKNEILLCNNQLLIEKIKDLQNKKPSIKNGKQHSSLSVNILPSPTGNILPTTPSVTIESATNRNETSTVVSPRLGSSNPIDMRGKEQPLLSNVNNDRQEINIANTTKENSWTTVVRKRSSDKKMVKTGNNIPVTTSNNSQPKKSRVGTLCTGISSTDAKIKGAIRRKWLYVGKVAGKDVAEADIKHFLSNLNGHELVEVKKLPTRGTNSAFSIGIPSDELFQTLNNSSFWPAGVVLRDFNFINFFRKRPISPKID